MALKRIPRTSGYPDGCTQSLHDAAYNAPGETAEEKNTAQAVIEARAEKEISEGDPRWMEYLAERADSADLHRYIALHMRGDPGWFLPDLQSQLKKDYADWRVEEAQRDGGEWYRAMRDGGDE